ncbi:outer membrane protein assembly factor BamD [Granulosicoccaceae sp. 1_MG-2023]|nr:outer membrane protein assembly factor BamD [Granulosicoccaceae sp. 1_MG-2023]
MRLIPISLMLLLLITGCASTGNPGDEHDPTRDWSAEKLYREATKKMNRGEYDTAVSYFETLESRFPFGDYTRQAQLDIAYAYLKQDEFDNAIASADQFIKLHPQHEAVAYAYYIKGLANFSRGQSMMERLFPRDIAKVDQNWLQSAYANFDTLLRRYPDSQYSEDARQRMIYLREQMARHELLTARYYYKRGAMVAAINRCDYLLEHFGQTPSAPKALEIMVKAYRVMGQDDLADKTLAILALNDPDNKLVKNSGQTNTGKQTTANN